MSFKPHGRHLVGGEWIGTDITFLSKPVSGEPHAFCEGNDKLIDQAVKSAEAAFWTYGYSTRRDRAAFLNKTEQ